MKKFLILSVLFTFLFASFASANSMTKDYNLNDIKKNAKTVFLNDEGTQINFYGLDENRDGLTDTIYIERIDKRGTEILKYTDTDYDSWLNELLFDRINGADGIFETTVILPPQCLKVSDIFPDKTDTRIFKAFY